MQIANYNKVTKAFRNFRYFDGDLQGLDRRPIKSALDLILWIAKDPVIARYIQTADFSEDGAHSFDNFRHNVDNKARDELILELLKGSQYCKQTDINLRDYTTLIQRAVCEVCDDPVERRRQPRRSYSQDAAAFLLTLLPNLKQLKLPVSWTTTHLSEKFIQAVITRSMKTSPCDSPSLGQVRLVTSQCRADYQAHGPRANLERISALLALQNVNEFCGSMYCIRGNFAMRFGPYLNVKSVSLMRCHIDHEAVMCLLRYMPNITSFRYFHWPPTDEVNDKEWNVSSFLEAIEHSPAGPKLEDLSIFDFETLIRTEGSRKMINFSSVSVISVAPGRVSMHGFLRLQKLTILLELSSVGILIPPSVLNLSVHFGGTPSHRQALDMLFNDLISGKRSYPLALQEFHIRTRERIRARFGIQFDKQFEDLRKLGVDVNWTDNDGHFIAE